MGMKMIEVVKIEDFVIGQLFRPYATHFIEYYEDDEFYKKQRKIENALRKNPELIIEMFCEIPEAKTLVINRLKKLGGIKWYRYLDMSNPVIQWVDENLEGMEEERN